MSALKHFRKKCSNNQNFTTSKKPRTTCSLPRKFAKRFIRFCSKERRPLQWKARESGLLKIFFQMYKWTGKIPISYLFYVLRKRRVFQFKFLRRRVATNDFLLKIGKKETDSCSFCAGSPETLTHLFWHCRSTQTFWNNVSQWTSEELDLTNLNITPFSPALSRLNRQHIQSPPTPLPPHC